MTIYNTEHTKNTQKYFQRNKCFRTFWKSIFSKVLNSKCSALYAVFYGMIYILYIQNCSSVRRVQACSMVRRPKTCSLASLVQTHKTSSRLAAAQKAAKRCAAARSELFRVFARRRRRRRSDHVLASRSRAALAARIRECWWYIHMHIQRREPQKKFSNISKLVRLCGPQHKM